MYINLTVLLLVVSFLCAGCWFAMLTADANDKKKLVKVFTVMGIIALTFFVVASFVFLPIASDGEILRVEKETETTVFEHIEIEPIDGDLIRMNIDGDEFVYPSNLIKGSTGGGVKHIDLNKSCVVRYFRIFGIYFTYTGEENATSVVLY